ncbi:MAG: alkaline phosphatase family protein [Acidobacteria bacterium]|nr:alkaline phosphatase family protein [Acidobacteriota bacterium]
MATDVRARQVIRLATGLATVALVVPLALAQSQGGPGKPGPYAAKEESGRVVLISLDGMGTQLFLDDPVAEELVALRAVRARGTMAAGLVPHMPSTTANTHAALWTGAWGDVNGITSNDMPIALPAPPSVSRRVSGYRSEGLRAEPLWVASARQGLKTVAQQATQVFPLTPASSGSDLPSPPFILHGYQAPIVAPARWLDAGDTSPRACTPLDGAATTCLSWRSGSVTFDAAVVDDGGAKALRVRVAGSPRGVIVRQAATETALPRGRELARYFSDGLLVDVPGHGPAMTYFRLFDLDVEPMVLDLFQSRAQELVLARGEQASRSDTIAFLERAGGFIGNGAHEAWDRQGLGGRPFWLGGDGTRERRFLETLELGIRQTIRHATYLWETESPRVFVGYVSMPDEIDHAWLGQARQDARYDAFRRWGYQLVDRAVDAYVSFIEPGDHIVFASDHGMTPITHSVRVNNALRESGLVAVRADGTADPDRSQVWFARNCLVVRTPDWAGGTVPRSKRAAVLRRAEAAVRAIRPPQGHEPVVSGFYVSDADRGRFGFGGPNGHDACVDFRPGYEATTAMGEGPVVRIKPRPTGEHGFFPTRRDMHGILIAAGPRIASGGTWPLQRAIDVAPLVSDLLGIAPPRDARGTVPR